MPVLNFKGKSTVYSYHLGVSFRSLEIDEKKSFPKKSKHGKKEKLSLDDNLIIHGDNLHALKAILPRYAGKVKCIYIDPPYNTGNEGWKYNDNVNSPLIKEWLGKVVDSDDLERHDKWLCMMWPRLQLLKELLSEDGVICISCDDTEVGNLISMLDEIFGPGNKEEVVTWRRRHNQPNDKSKPIAKTAEFIIIYAKNLEFLKEQKTFNGLPLTGNFTNPDNDPRGPWASKPWKAGSNQTGSRYKIKTPTGKLYDEEWLGTKNTFNFLLKDKRIVFPKKGNGLPRKKYYESERITEGQAAHNFWNHKEFGSNQDASREIQEIGIAFDNPKPSLLIKSIIQIFSNKKDIILDSFSGSGTTAQAVLELNKEDGGNRKSVLVECEDYADKITAERIRRVIKGVPKTKEEKLKKGLGGSFTYCTLGKEINEENLIKGKSLPTYKILSDYVFYIATGQTLERVSENKDFYIGKSDKETAFFVIYKPNTKFLRSKESALNLDRKEKIQKIMKQKNCKKAVVFAPIHYFDSANELAKEGIIFCQLPFAIYKIAGV